MHTAQIYFPGLVHHVGHRILNRKFITATVKNYFACDALFYRISDILFTLMLESHQESEAYVRDGDTLSDGAAYVAHFWAWYAIASRQKSTPPARLATRRPDPPPLCRHEANIRSGDVPYVFYSGFVFGVGMLYRVAKQAISMRDALMCYALLLPSMGLFRICGKHNLMRQCFLSLAKLYSSPEPVARALVANATKSFSNRPYHALATDELLEMLQGFVKRGRKSSSVASAKIHTGLNFYLNAIRENLARASRGPPAAAKAKGVHVADGHADTLRGG